MLARARIAWGERLEELVACPAWQNVPDWERFYLVALDQWLGGDMREAKVIFQRALAGNLHQTAVRLGYGAVAAGDDPEEALRILTTDAPIREMIVTRAAILSRIGRYDEAEESLRLLGEDGNIVSEPVRFRWKKGADGLRRQEHALRVALIERRGAWKEADRYPENSDLGTGKKSIRQCRELYRLSREMQSVSSGQNWRRSICTQKAKRLRHEIGKGPITGEGLFYKCLSMFENTSRSAPADWERLLHQHSWLAAEEKIGGVRLVILGDRLLRTGNAASALQAYGRIPNKCDFAVDQRVTLATLYMQIADKVVNQPPLERDIERLVSPSSGFELPYLAAVGELLAGNSEASSAHLRAAEDRGAPEDLCRCLQKFYLREEDSHPSNEPQTGHADLGHEANAVIRLLCGHGGMPDKMAEYIRQAGDTWVDLCPFDPQDAARAVLNDFAEKQRWEEAYAIVEKIMAGGMRQAKEIAGLLKLRHLLSIALQNGLEEAEKKLAELLNSEAGEAHY
jgi:tetratricopeptide (TPR) repeat protein